MKIQIAPNLPTLVEYKHILLDTNVFIDAFNNPEKFAKFFNELKDNHSTIVTIKPVLHEFFKGAQDDKKLKEKILYAEEITDTILPFSEDIYKNVDTLIKKYREKGKSLSTVDLMLGAYLMKYGENIFLLTKDTTDFSNKIFEFVSHVHLVHDKGVHILGLYCYS